MAVTFCTLASGSKGNAYLIAGEKTKILVDAGLSSKTITERLEEIGVKSEEIDGILISHEHTDHIGGVRVFSKKYDVPVYANPQTMDAVRHKFPDLEKKNVRLFTNGESFIIGEMEILPFRTPHDSVSSCMFSVFCGQNKITVATDLGHMTKTVLEACKYSDLLVLEANHDLQMLINGPYTPALKQRIQGPNGHLPNDVCGKTAAFLLDYGLKQVVLAHLSEENNTPELAYQTVCACLSERGAVPQKDIHIEVAEQHRRGKCFFLN